MTTTPRTGLTLLSAGQDGAEVSTNSALNLLDAGWGGVKILDRNLTAPPGSPSNGDSYIVATSPTGGWAGQAAKIAVYDSAWKFITPSGGMMAYVHDEKVLFCYSSQESEWFPVQRLWSTVEHWTGQYGEGGTKIYAKCFAGLACPDTTTTAHAHSISSLDVTKFINFEISLTNGTTVTEFNHAPAASMRIYAAIDATNLSFVSNGDYSSYTADARLEYTKT